MCESSVITVDHVREKVVDGEVCIRHLWREVGYGMTG